MDFVYDGGHTFLVWLEDVKILGADGVGRGIDVGAGETDALDGPGRHRVQLFINKGVDLAARNIGLEAATHGRKNLGVVSKESF